MPSDPSRVLVNTILPSGHHFGEKSRVLTNNTLTGWYDRLGKENSDKCLGRFGTVYQTPNGGLANIKLGGHDYLLQMKWVNDCNGYCAMSYP